MLAVPVIVADATRSYRTPAEVVHALDGVTLAASWGQFLCIHGPSGSGKSTLLNVIAGLDLVDSGQVQVDGHELSQLSENERAHLRLTTIGVVFQGDVLVEEFTAAENVALPLEARGIKSEAALAQAAEALEQVGIGALGPRWPREMSGGQRQRVGIARALVGGRRLLLADEPTAALDRANSASLFALLADLCSQGALVIVCSHDPLAGKYADIVYNLVDGRLEPT